MRNFALTVASVATIAAASPAAACSVDESYRVPTSLELVEGSKAIVLARVGDELPNEDPWDGEIALHPELLIAGRSLPGELRFRARHGAAEFRPTPSNPLELANANPDAFSGGCNRYIFNRGMLLLLFLKQDEAGQFQIINRPFARTLEDVPSSTSLWVRAIRYYVAIAQLPRNQRKSAMAAEVVRLRATGSNDDKLLAADIQRQISRRRTQNYD